MKRHRRRRRPRQTRAARSPRHTTIAPRTADELFALSDRDQDRWEHLTRGVSHMRESGLSASQAARDAHMSLEVFVRLAGPALRKDRKGRWVAKSRDRLLRVF